ncbi:MAG: GNAT family N-acetyltransferase [Prevotella sp.]|nr:GNAT family N-acetyltransferase [Prevotella sp.]
MESRSFFHSPELFRISERTSGQKPYMVVAEDNGVVVAHLLAVLRRRGSLIPPYLFTQGRIYGEGEYSPDINKEEVFKLMLSAITQKLKHKLCLNIEFSDLSQKMFGYKHFKQEGYFPVHWMEVHNSLHSMPPEERLDEKMSERINRLIEQEVEFKQVEDYQQFRKFYKMLNQFPSLKIRRYLPPAKQFWELGQGESCRLFATIWRGKVIGGCVCVYSNNNAYLWYLASKRKSHPLLYPATATVWGAISDAYERKFRHIYFMDVGLPFKKSPYRDFILRFGGMEVSSYRWFRFTFGWLNYLMRKIYKE